VIVIYCAEKAASQNNIGRKLAKSLKICANFFLKIGRKWKYLNMKAMAMHSCAQHICAT